MGRAGALALAVALFSAAPVFAAPSRSTDSSATSGGYRTPPASGSAIGGSVDEQTAEFRKKLAEKQAKLDEFNAQLEKLDAELEAATENYNAAILQLEQMKQTVATAQSDLENAKSAYTVQSDLLGERANSMYKDGSMAAVEVLLGSKSVGDFVQRVKFLNTIGQSDAEIAAALKGQRSQLEQRVNELRDAQAVAESLEFELKARKIEILSRIQDRQEMMAATQGDILQMLDAEAARRKSEESALLQELLANASAKGINAAPGTPVETALAYHGVPYLWGGETPAGLDCSGLVLYVFAQHGVDLPHYSGLQFTMGEKVSPVALQPGDVVFFGSPVHHVGIYMGGGYYIHAPRTGDFVKISRLADRSDFAGARRYPWTLRVGEPRNAVVSTTDALSGVGGR